MALAAVTVVSQLTKQPVLPTVQTMTLSPTTLSNTVSVTGTVQSSNSYQVYANYSGQVEQVMVEVGDQVQAGDVLCQFDVESLEMNIAQSEATLSQTQNAAYLQLRSAQKNLENAEKNLEEGLNSNMISADSAVDSAEIGKQNANISLETAQNSADSIQDVLADYREAYSDALSDERAADKAVREAEEKLKALMNSTANSQQLQQINQDIANTRADIAGKQSQLSGLQQSYNEAVAAREQVEQEIAAAEAAGLPTDDLYEKLATAETNETEAKEAVTDLIETINWLQDQLAVHEERLAGYSSEISDAQAQLSAAIQAQSAAQAAKLQAKSALEANRSSTDAADSALDQAELGVQSAQNSYNTAVAQQAATQAAIQQQIDSYRDAVTSAQIQGDTTAQELALEQLYKQLEDATVTAPISGTVTAVYAEEGVPGQGLLFVIEDIDHLEISTTIKEYDITSVEVGMPALIRTDAIDDKEFQGTLLEISPTASKNGDSNSSNVLFDATVGVDDQETGLRVGMNARMDIVIAQKENVFGVPYDAVHTAEDGSSFIIVVEPLQNEKGESFVTRYIPVTTGMETDFYMEVISDQLSEGLQIVATGELIAEGTAVQVAK